MKFKLEMFHVIMVAIFAAVISSFASIWYVGIIMPTTPKHNVDEARFSLAAQRICTDKNGAWVRDGNTLVCYLEKK